MYVSYLYIALTALLHQDRYPCEHSPVRILTGEGLTAGGRRRNHKDIAQYQNNKTLSSKRKKKRKRQKRQKKKKKREKR